MAGALKDEGNASFKAGAYEEAVDAYTRALELDPQMHVCFSNRSAAYLKLWSGSDLPETSKTELLEKALLDANRVVEINPSWAKGYSRQAAVLQELKRFAEAESACRRGLTFGADSALQSRLKEVLSRAFLCKLLGRWHGTVAETLGGYDQEMEFLDVSSVQVTVLGRSIVGKYWVDGAQEPIHLDIQVPMQEAPPGMPPPPPVPYIAKTDEAGLHICCPFMTMDRPKEFTGPGYCLMKPGPLSTTDVGAEVKKLSHEQQLIECAKELIKALPSSKLEEVQQTDSEEVTRDKLMAQVRFESAMFAVQKKFGDETMKQVLEATNGVAPAALAGTSELRELEDKMKRCGLKDAMDEAAPSAPATSSSPPQPVAREANKSSSQATGGDTKGQGKPAVPEEAPTKADADSGRALQVAGLAALGAAIATIAFVAWRRQRR